MDEEEQKDFDESENSIGYLINQVRLIELKVKYTDAMIEYSLKKEINKKK